MSVKFKFFQIMDDKALDRIEECLQSRQIRRDSLNKIRDDFGAYELYEYSRGGVAALVFADEPDRSIWKKVKHGYLPKVKTDEYKKLHSAPEVLDYQDVIKDFGFGGEMIIGEPKPGQRGFPMHSSSIKGNRKTKFFVIKVPYQDDFDKPTDCRLKEIKEWEMMKGIEEGNDE